MTDTQSAVLESLREFIDDDAAATLSAETPLVGVLDSFRIVQLVTVLEQKFQIQFQQIDLLNEEAWSSPEQIATLVAEIQTRTE